MTTLQQRITSSMTVQQKADRDAIDRAIARTRRWLGALIARRRELAVPVPAITVDGSGVIDTAAAAQAFDIDQGGHGLDIFERCVRAGAIDQGGDEQPFLSHAEIAALHIDPDEFDPPGVDDVQRHPEEECQA